jgi:hypothetical protein
LASRTTYDRGEERQRTAARPAPVWDRTSIWPRWRRCVCAQRLSRTAPCRGRFPDADAAGDAATAAAAAPGQLGDESAHLIFISPQLGSSETTRRAGPEGAPRRRCERLGHRQLVVGWGPGTRDVMGIGADRAGVVAGSGMRRLIGKCGQHLAGGGRVALGSTRTPTAGPSLSPGADSRTSRLHPRLRPRAVQPTASKPLASYGTILHERANLGPTRRPAFMAFAGAANPHNPL